MTAALVPSSGFAVLVPAAKAGTVATLPGSTMPGGAARAGRAIRRPKVFDHRGRYLKADQICAGADARAQRNSLQDNRIAGREFEY